MRCNTSHTLNLKSYILKSYKLRFSLDDPKEEMNDVSQGTRNRSILLEWSVHTEKRDVEDVKANQSLIVKGFGLHERFWTLFCSHGQVFEPLSWAGPRRRLFLVQELVTCQSSCFLNKEIQNGKITIYFGIQVLWPNINMKNAQYHYPPIREMHIKTAMNYHFLPSRMTIIKNTDNKCW